MTVWFGPCPHPPTHLLIGTPPWDADLAQQSLGFALDPDRLRGSLLSPWAQGAVTTALGHGEVVWAPGLRKPEGEAGQPGSAAVWGRGLGSTHRLEKSKMPESGLFPWVSKHVSWFFFLYTQPNKENHLAWVQ